MSSAKPASWPHDSVGLVEPQCLHFDQALPLDCGRQLDQFDLVVETYGELNAARSNAVLICHALSGDHHAAGYHSTEDRKPGWWDSCIGPGKPIDTNRFFVVSLNNLGGCGGSTGPTSQKPGETHCWGPDFPIVTVRDWVRSQHFLMQRLDIPQWAAVVGGSLGGMQALQWSVDYPQLVRHIVAIATAPRLSTQNIAFNEVARQAILTDPEFHGGRYAEHGVVPQRGLMLARMLGHITYLSDNAMANKFGRDLISGNPQYSFEAEFEVESYLRYQGKSFIDRFDANTYLLMTKALDYFDPAREFDDDDRQYADQAQADLEKLSAAFANSDARFLLIAFTRDWRFSPQRSRELMRALMHAGKSVSYACIDSPLGHDDFLVPVPEYLRVFGQFMRNVAQEVAA